jgi:hypothetical protein
MTIPLSETLLIVIVSSAGTGGAVWGLLRSDVTRVLTDMTAVKKALGLEPSNGEIKTAFVPRAECRLMEDGVKERLKGCEERVGDHEHRLTAVEARETQAS